MQFNFAHSKCKTELVFQMVQQLVVDAVQAKILTIAPPILTRCFQEMGTGLLLYSEAKKLSHVPFPYAYSALTRFIVVCQACLTPFFMAMYCKGSSSSFFYTFVGTFLLWYLNGVADSLDNPFRKEASTLELS